MAIDTTNLISVWELSEASGNALDSFGSNTLTDNNTVGAAAGKIISARDFEESNGEAFTCASNSSLAASDIDFTIGGWFKFETVNPFHTVGLITKGPTNDGSTSEYSLQHNSSNNSKPSFKIRYSSFGTQEVTWGSTLSTGVWYWILAYHDSVNNLMGIQVDNGTAVTVSHSSGMRNTGAQFVVGGFDNYGSGATDLFDGLAEQAFIFKRLLTSGEKSELYNSGNGLAYSSWAGGGGTAGNLLRGRAISPGRIFGGSILC